MKTKKTYIYPYRYLTNLFKLDIKEESLLNICVDIKDNDEDEINVYFENEKIFSYRDNGKTILYLKGLGKFMAVGEIAASMGSGCHFDISDKFDDTIGVSKIHTLNNDYIIIGGYNHWSIMINIDGLSKKDIIDSVVKSFISYSQEYGFVDLKTMYLRILNDVAIYMDSRFLKKPYIYIIKEL